MRTRIDDLVFPNTPGIDLGGSSHWVAVPRHCCDTPVRGFGAMNDDLNAMADWLLACGADAVALESTGVYWIPVFGVLEERGLNVFRVDARQMKYVPGRKSDVTGTTGQEITRAIVAGERDPKELARHRNARVKASEQDMTKALTGNWRDEQLFVLRHALAMYDDISRHLVEGNAKLQALLSRLGTNKVDLGKAPRAGSKTRAEFDTRRILANWAGVDLTRINGLGLAAVMKILSEVGPDLSRFETVKHFCSWLGLCPGTKISGGKLLSSKTKRAGNRVRQALKIAAMSVSHSDSALGAFYRRISARMDKPCATTATAHKPARTVYFMLTRGEAYVDKSQQHYEEQQRQRSIAALGYKVSPTAVPA